MIPKYPSIRQQLDCWTKRFRYYTLHDVPDHDPADTMMYHQCIGYQLQLLLQLRDCVVEFCRGADEGRSELLIAVTMYLQRHEWIEHQEVVLDMLSDALYFDDPNRFDGASPWNGTIVSRDIGMHQTLSCLDLPVNLTRLLRQGLDTDSVGARLRACYITLPLMGRDFIAAGWLQPVMQVVTGGVTALEAVVAGQLETPQASHDLVALEGAAAAAIALQLAAMDAHCAAFIWSSGYLGELQRLLDVLVKCTDHQAVQLPISGVSTCWVMLRVGCYLLLHIEAGGLHGAVLEELMRRQIHKTAVAVLSVLRARYQARETGLYKTWHCALVDCELMLAICAANVKASEEMVKAGLLAAMGELYDGREGRLSSDCSLYGLLGLLMYSCPRQVMAQTSELNPRMDPDTELHGLAGLVSKALLHQTEKHHYGVVAAAYRHAFMARESTEPSIGRLFEVEIFRLTWTNTVGAWLTGFRVDPTARRALAAGLPAQRKQSLQEQQQGEDKLLPWQQPCCASCGCARKNAPAARLRKCAACQVVAYCSVTCQKRDWLLRHRQVCVRQKEG